MDAGNVGIVEYEGAALDAATPPGGAIAGGQRNPQAHEWPAEKVQRFVELWNEGVSASLIGLALGVSRNAVLGKRNRMGLQSRKVEARKEYADGIKIKRPTYQRIRKDKRTVAPSLGFKRLRVPKLSAAPFEPRAVALPEPSAEFRCDFRGLDREKQCHFPHGDDNFQFCGHPKTRGPYCDYHAALCWRRA